MIVCLLALTATAWAEEAALAPKIDALLFAKVAKPAHADDAEFLRRVWLDFDGGIPSAEEARAFLADKTPDKRAKLINKLIAAPLFAVRAADAFNVMLM